MVILLHKQAKLRKYTQQSVGDVQYENVLSFYNVQIWVGQLVLIFLEIT